ncbi:hypothetical protein [Murinocardiopsis flavida]|uniref:hypothetical protein n=1 Tax=Murinocardiopsis flavida TaxID=645275 RepID=UPI0011B1D77D|nr:hypothetical protein [Murinocardiopsis flavida]
MLMMITLGGCALMSENEPSASPAPSGNPSPSKSTLSTEDAALEAYEGMWSIVVENSHTTEPDVTDLDRFAKGEALELAKHGLGAESGENVIARGEPEFSPEVTSVDEKNDSAEIKDCLDSTNWLREDADTGELIEEEPTSPIRRTVEATADYDGLTWRISQLRIFEQGSC